MCGPTKTRTLYGERYFILFIDDYTRIMWVAFLREKSEAFGKFKIFKAKVENESGIRIKCLRSDRRGEFTSNQFNIFCEDNRIHRQVSTTRTPQQNGIAERRNRTVSEAARAMMLEGNVAHVYWREVVTTAVYTISRV